MRLSTLGALAAGAAATLGAALAIAAAREAAAPLADPNGAGPAARLEGATRVLVYRIERDARRPLRFTLSRPAREVKIISQPTIAPAAWDKASGWTYGYTAVLRDADGDVIASHRIYSRGLHPARLRPFKRPERFRRDGEGQVALQDDVVLVAPRPAAAVDLTYLYAEPGVRGIDARVYERLPFIGNTAHAAFRRRTPSEQAALARADVLPAQIMSAAEQAALMANRWKVTGPVGIAGEDYSVSVVYERRQEREGG